MLRTTGYDPHGGAWVRGVCRPRGDSPTEAASRRSRRRTQRPAAHPWRFNKKEPGGASVKLSWRTASALWRTVELSPVPSIRKFPRGGVCAERVRRVHESDLRSGRKAVEPLRCNGSTALPVNRLDLCKLAGLLQIQGLESDGLSGIP